jgi:hypothetical protein
MNQAEFTRSVAQRVIYTRWPAVWAQCKLGIKLDHWQNQLVSAPPGTRAIALCFRQAGKTTAAAIAAAHTMILQAAGSTSLAIAPSQRQSAELVRRLRGFLLKAGEKLKVDNTFSVETLSGSRCLALPGSDDGSIRGLTVTGLLVIDEAARVTQNIFHAVRPMLIRHNKRNRLMVISTAWLKEGDFYSIWTEGDPRDWLKIRANVNECSYIDQVTLEAERRALGDKAFRREYLSEFGAVQETFFNLDSIEAAAGGLTIPVPPTTPLPPDHDPVVQTAQLFRAIP